MSEVPLYTTGGGDAGALLQEYWQVRPHPEYSRANSYPWSPFPLRRARPRPGRHTLRLLPAPDQGCC